MNQAGFNLRKWSTNCEELRKIVPESQQELKTDKDKIKLLGSTLDVFEIDLKLNINFQPKSKRELLSEVASLYDPLGWIAPVVIKAKIVLQQLWKQNLGWDDNLSPTTTGEWMKLKNEAMHIELVSDATADAFIAALRRVIARRGYIKNIFSDNATCFVSANKILQEKSEKERDEFNRAIFTELANDNIKWHFSPPAGPHFNGLAEAAAKSLKKHLKICIGETALTFEELSTLLSQIESAVNSRPLCAISTDPNDMSILTP